MASSNSTRDLLAEAISIVIEVKAELSSGFTQLKKLEDVLHELKDNIIPPEQLEQLMKRSADDQEEREHKRHKALFQRRGLKTPTLELGQGWDDMTAEQAAPEEAPTLPAGNYEPTLRR